MKGLGIQPGLIGSTSKGSLIRFRCSVGGRKVRKPSGDYLNSARRFEMVNDGLDLVRCSRRPKPGFDVPL
jgi:hypothetical protein